jgi:hypothetical protein
MIDGKHWEKMRNILKWLAIIIAVQFVIWVLFFFRKEVIEWADKPADNASVILIAVVVFYVFSLPITSKLNKLIDMIDTAVSEDETGAAEETVDEDYFD